MKPFKACPNCGSSLNNLNYNRRWFQQTCAAQCHLGFSQYFPTAFTNDELSYLRFDLKDFYVYLYFEKGYFPNQAHIYSFAELQAKNLANPCLVLPSSKLTFPPTPDLNDRIKTLLLFS